MKIKGIPVGTPMARPDWNQDDPKKADYIRNKPIPDSTLSVSGKAADAKATGDALNGKLPAMESADYPGCYYRMVGEEQEWINPPMVIGSEYRTTERYGKNPLYTKWIYVESLPNATVKNVDTGVSAGKIIRYSGMAWNSIGNSAIPLPYPPMNNDSSAVSVTFLAQTMQIYTSVNLSSCFAMIQIWYLK